MQNIQTYQTIANAFTVVDLAEPIHVEAAASDRLIDVWDYLMEDEHGSWFCLVRDGRRIVGYLALDDDCFIAEIDSTALAVDAANPITPDLLVPASMPILHILPLFEEHFFYFVLEGNDVSHVVSFVDLDKPPLQISLFSLFMELEAVMLKTIASDWAALPRRIEHLSKSRIDLARNLCKKKYGSETSGNLLRCTSFADKLTIFQTDSVLSSLLHFQGSEEQEEFIGILKDLRNQIAHGDSFLRVINAPRKFNWFVLKLNSVISDLVSEMT
jgi:hypothetical protein